MRTLDHFEFKLTKPNGTVIYRTATQHILPPEIDNYIKIEQINHYQDGSQEILAIKPSKSSQDDEPTSYCGVGDHHVPGDQIAGVGNGKNGKDIWFCREIACQKEATKALVDHQGRDLAEILAHRNIEKLTRPPIKRSTRQIPF